jgi:hypothetical protein
MRSAGHPRYRRLFCGPDGETGGISHPHLRQDLDDSGGESLSVLKQALYAPAPRRSPERFRCAWTSVPVQCCGQQSKLLCQTILFRGRLIQSRSIGARGRMRSARVFHRQALVVGGARRKCEWHARITRAELVYRVAAYSASARPWRAWSTHYLEPVAGSPVEVRGLSRCATSLPYRLTVLRPDIR